MTDITFLCEYAKSSRSSCKICHKTIKKDVLRIGKRFPASGFDGYMVTWHHLKCVKKWGKFVNKANEVKGFDSLRWEDQNKLKKLLGEKVEEKKDEKENEKENEKEKEKEKDSKKKKDEKKKKSKKRKNEPKTKTRKTRLRSRKTKTKKKETSSTESTSKETETTSDSESEEFSLVIPEQKTNENIDPDQKLAQEVEIQTKKFWEVIDQLKKNVSTKEMKMILKENDLPERGGQDDLAKKIAGALLFGLPLCPQCQKRTLIWSDGQYKCIGSTSTWTKCTFRGAVDDSKTILLKIPDDISNSWLSKLKPQKAIRKSRMFLEKKEEAKEMEKKSTLLLDFVIAFSGSLSNSKEDLIEIIEDNEGEYVSRVQKSCTHIIATKEALKTNKTLKSAKKWKTPILSEDFLIAVRDERVVDCKKYLLSGKLPKDEKILTLKERPLKKETKENLAKNARTSSQEESSEYESEDEKIDNGKKKVIKKGGVVIDEECPIAEEYHVYREGNEVYDSMLNKTNIESNQNSYYILQLFKHDSKKKFHVWAKWGRVGTTIGGNILHGPWTSKSQAIEFFKTQFSKKTGNEWENRFKAEKKEGLFYPIAIQHDAESDQEQSEHPPSNLPKGVQEIVEMLFDIDNYNHTMKELEIDVNSMPLGQLTKDHIKQGNSVLTELQNIIENEPDNSQKLLDYSNRFYTIIPHIIKRGESFPLIDNKEILESKIHMLEALIDIEIASALIKESKSDKSLNPIDIHYSQLKTKLDPIQKDSDTFNVINKYLKNTHGKTHSHYSLDLLDAFEVEREGEFKKFEEFQDLDPRYLLWHGSRLTNFVGILSQGLRIAPPEAPVTGYMFGKGIYFADMCSKSANYCHATPSNNIAFMLLCEVALGKKKKLEGSKYMEKPPKGFNSTKGCGRTIPDPEKFHEMEDGVIVPYGKPVQSKKHGRSLLYNEYIVYRENQARIRYLLKVKFNFKGRW